MSNIGQNIKNRRIELGLTADQLANRLQKSRATIYRYESTDADNMPIGILEPLARALSTTPAELMGWSGGAVKVTTNLSFDDKSPLHALTQAYLRRPSLVQDEIIRRLEGLDATFSNKVSKLLQASGDINGFMQGTGLPFATVGKFMQGETVLTTPAEAERIATYFHTNVVDLFFGDDTKAKATPIKAAKTPTPAADQEDDKPPFTKYGEKLKSFIDLQLNKKIVLEEEKKSYYDILRDKKVNSIVEEVINWAEQGCPYGPFDEAPALRVIANEIMRTDFIATYVETGDAGREELKHKVRNAK
ncbi:MAG: helix-turn-helix domain-containing protein [Selenomonas sp.]|uniref:helix-turn-helix domain-containing protein n=1 Tax=Selenomonas sp. TaxID=2053611 RepID=UPI0025CFC072|nr:helix-turn-helix domain-containing protein [Selenomonas sp.]MCR5438015.1 helix-turn-helix domain-containing protein [Selenomonas sp.]